MSETKKSHSLFFDIREKQKTASDPLGTAWKVGEAIVQITTLPTRIALGAGEAAVELAKLSPKERQGLVDELIAKGRTELAKIPVSVAAEKAGEIVGTIAMEAVLAKGWTVGLKSFTETYKSLKCFGNVINGLDH